MLMTKLNNLLEKNKNQKILLFFSIMLFAVVTFAINLHTINTDDYFFLNIGRYILENQTFPKTDQFTLLGELVELKMTAFQWIYNVLIYLGYSTTGGWMFLRIATTIASLMIASLIAKNILIKSQSYFLAITTVLLFSMSSILSFHLTIQMRPQTFVLPILLLIIYLIQKNKYLWIIPFLYILSYNIHGGLYPIFFLATILFTVHNKKQWWLIPTSLITVLINPYSYETLISPFKFYKYQPQISLLINEWLPLYNHNFYLSPLLFIVLALLLLLGLFMTKHILKSEKINMIFFIESIILIALYYLIFNGIRYLIFIPIIMIPFLSSSIVEELKLIKDKLKLTNIFKNFIYIVIITPIIMFIISVIFSASFSNINFLVYGDQIIVEENFITDDTMNFMKENNITKVLNQAYGLGGQLNYYGIKALYDNRTEIYLPPNNKGNFNYLSEYQELAHNPQKMLEAAQKYDIQYLLLHKKQKPNMINDLISNGEVIFINHSGSNTLIKLN